MDEPGGLLDDWRDRDRGAHDLWADLLVGEPDRGAGAIPAQC
jgi:hypothetical protein